MKYKIKEILVKNEMPGVLLRVGGVGVIMASNK